MPKHRKISSAKLRFFFQLLKREWQDLPKNKAFLRFIKILHQHIPEGGLKPR